MNTSKKQWMAPVATEIEVNTGSVANNYENLESDLTS